MAIAAISVDAKTLIVYYSYTNNVESIVKVVCFMVQSGQNGEDGSCGD